MEIASKHLIMIRIAINGCGRIGRAVTRLGLDAPDLEVVAINDIIGADNLAYLLKYDSVHGRYDHDIHCHGNKLMTNGKEIKIFNRKNPLLLPWRKLKVDVAVEATGRFRTFREALLHRVAGAKRILLTANPRDRKIPVIISGVNEQSYAGETVVSAASCSANCAGPIARILHENLVIQSGFLTAVHAYTRNQQLLDGEHSGDYRRGRAAACNIVPSSSDAARIVAQTIPSLQSKIDGTTIRVPVPDGSMINLICTVEKSVNRKTVNALIRENIEKNLTGVMRFSDEPLVSKDVVNDTHSAVFDSLLTDVTAKAMVRVVCWFDHEWGYAARVLDLIRMIGNSRKTEAHHDR